RRTLAERLGRTGPGAGDADRRLAGVGSVAVRGVGRGPRGTLQEGEGGRAVERGDHRVRATAGSAKDELRVVKKPVGAGATPADEVVRGQQRVAQGRERVEDDRVVNAGVDGRALRDVVA